MFYTAASIAKTECFYLQKTDKVVFYGGRENGGAAHWTSDINRAHSFVDIVQAISEAKKLNLSNCIVIRKLYQVINVEIEQPVVEEEMRLA